MSCFRAARRTYVSLALASGKSIRASAIHFLPVSRGCASTDFAAHELVTADSVTTADCVFEAAKEGATALSVAVKSVANEQHDGAYNFHTEEGTILVDGVAASVFTAQSWPLGYGRVGKPMQRLAALTKFFGFKRFGL